MTYQKNLGRVRGKKGGYYDINIEQDNTGIYRVRYDFKNNEQERVPAAKNPTYLYMPVYVPEWEKRNGEPTGRIKFKLYDSNNLPPEDGYINLKGEPGEPGKVSIDIEHTNYRTLQEMETAVSNGTFTPNSHTIYAIKRSNSLQELYIYDEVNEHFDSMDGVDLTNYWTIDQTENYVNDCLYDIAYYDRLALGLLDISYEVIDSGSSGSSMDINELAEIFARQEDLYVEVSDTNNDGNIDNIIINVGKNE